MNQDLLDKVTQRTLMMAAVQLQSPALPHWPCRELVLETHIPNLGGTKAVYLKPAHSVMEQCGWLAKACVVVTESLVNR